MRIAGGSWVVRLANGLSAISLAFAGMVLSPVAVYADEGDPPPTPDAAGRRVEGLLERCLEREQEWLAEQTDNVARASQGLDKAGGLIEQARAGGIDTAELEGLLSDGYASLETAQTEHSRAAAILDGHAGFDDSGAVVDREQARATCLDARQALNDGRQALVEVREIAVEMREVVRDWWRDRRPAAREAGG